MDIPTSLMMEAVRTSETSVDNHFTRQYNTEDSSEHHTCRRENLKSQTQNHCAEFCNFVLSYLVRDPRCPDFESCVPYPTWTYGNNLLRDIAFVESYVCQPPAPNDMT
jgi:hypothetical protein